MAVETELASADAQRARFKQQAAEYAASLVAPGMVVGLGVGTTAIYVVRRLAALLAAGELVDIVGVPCALTVEAEARRLGVPLTTLEDRPAVDMTIDGADEVDPQLNLIKGGGGALLREKIVAQASQREVIIVDESKLSPRLGTHWALPVEVLAFGWRAQALFIEALGGQPVLRRNTDGSPFRTDQGNLILDCAFGPIADPHSLALRLDERAGIAGHGLFLDLTTDLIVAGTQGISHIRAAKER